jgi:hypothetical protein
MIVACIGLFHFIHSPLLIFYPFWINNWTYDIYYINYFFIIIFAYTFINGECPISYISKLLINRNYIAGTNINYSPEMKYIFSSNTNISRYFQITTSLYIISLSFVIYRANIPIYAIIIPCSEILVYSLYIHNILHKTKYFKRIQEITKYNLFLVICWLFIVALRQKSS